MTEYIPCSDCKMRGIKCRDCKVTKCDNFREELEKINDELSCANVRIANELEPRLRAEKASYDSYVTRDKAADWDDAFEYHTNFLIEMFDEDFVKELDFTQDTLIDKIARLILSEKELQEERKYDGTGKD